MQTMIGKPLWVIGHRVTILDTLGDYAILEVVTEPGVPGPPPHRHYRFSEFFYVADGALEIMVGDTWQRVERGGSLSVPAGVVHTFRNPAARPSICLTGFSPGNFTSFFVAFGVPADRPDAKAASMAPELLARLSREAGDYDMIIASRTEAA